MGSLSIWHWLIVGAVVLVLFGGKGKISDIMGDVAKGIKSFKKGMAEEDEKPEDPGAQVDAAPILSIGSDQTAADPARSADRHGSLRLRASRLVRVGHVSSDAS